MQNRNKKTGRFARKSMKYAFIIASLSAIAFFPVRIAFNKYYSHELTFKANVEAAVDGNALAQEIVAAKVKAAQDGLLNDLAQKCETSGVKEPDAAILLDTNNRMSIGSWMFQITTVQHYVSLFEHREITRVEAIEIAVDHDKAMELARKIVFTENGGLLHNWTNCTSRLDLLPRLKEINEFSK